MKPRTLLTVAVIVGFIALLTWNTMSAQKVTCNVCVAFNGLNNCASASNETEVEAARSAQSTACGPIAKGMNDIIACERRVAVSQKCQGK